VLADENWMVDPLSRRDMVSSQEAISASVGAGVGAACGVVAASAGSSPFGEMRGWLPDVGSRESSVQVNRS
jgi:hypothetical protein